MELTITSALSGDGALGHLSFVLLIVSMLMRSMVWLRVLVIASALVGLSYSYLILTDPVGVFWEGLLIAVNLGQLGLTWWQNRRTRFAPDERRFAETRLPGLSPRRLRELLDAGEWADSPAGTVLSREGHPVAALAWICRGSADVLVSGRLVARCGEGDLIGELTVGAGTPATGTVRAAGPLRIWRIEAERLRGLMARRDDTRQALEAAFFSAVRDKIVAGNRRTLADAAE